MKKKKQQSLFNKSELDSWKKEWQGMPEFIQEDKEPIQKITMNFMNREDVKEFSRLIKQSITPKTNSLRFPKCNIKKLNNYSYKDES